MMPERGADSKAARQSRLLHLFGGGRSWGAAELARELGCTARTVQRDLAELGTSGRLPVEEEGAGPATRYRLREDGRVHLGSLRLDVREGTALYLAARLLAQQIDDYNLHVMGALDKLVAAMPAHIGASLRELLRATAVRHARGTDLAAHFSALVLGWAHRKAVMVRYRPAHAPAACTCLVHPYLFEPSGIGRTIYVIGHVDPPVALRTLKLERIVYARLTDDIFEIPPDFDGAALLARAWGVMAGDDEPATVRLRFNRFVAERVKETMWHPTERVRDLPDGGCLWEAEIGDVVEIGPWVRGWGSDCEVLAPENLRIEVIGHVRRLARGYDISLAHAPSAIPSTMLLEGQATSDETCG